MRIERIFTKNKTDIYSDFNFVTFKSKLSATSNKKEDLVNIEAPSTWSQIAVDILTQKFLRKRGIPTFTKPVYEEEIPSWLYRSVIDSEKSKTLEESKVYTMETSVKQIVRRLAGEWTYWGFKENYFDSEEDAKAFFDEVQYSLIAQSAAPNSPQWFNTGLYWAYGLDGESQGHYFYNEKTSKVERSKNAYERPQPHACFIQSINDDLVNKNGIMDLWIKEARLFKFGSGTGTNFSNIRGENEPLSGGGYSSGLLSFLKIGDSAAGAIKSGGTTRRAAKMVILDVDHPDIEKFINWKVVEEQKIVALVTGSKIAKVVLKNLMDTYHRLNFSVSAQESINKSPELKNIYSLAKKLMIPENYIVRTLELAKNGHKEIDFIDMDTNWNSESYQTVSGQNSNNSVRLDNKFLEALEKDQDWNLIYRSNAKVAKTVKAKKIWNDINYAAWSCGDPGLQFDTTINEWHTCPKSGRINASNPCSEYLFLDNTACNLASLNLMFFRLEDGNIDVEKFIHTVKLWTLILEISVAMAQFPSEEIALLSYKFRTLGLGYANIGALLMSNGLPYDSDKGRNLAAAITALLTGTAYKTSALIAKEKGAFSEFELNKNDMLRVISNHKLVAQGKTSGYNCLTVLPVPLDHNLCFDKKLLLAALESWDDAYEYGKTYGFRNAQVSVVAPTGTIALVMDCSTTGIEPDFSLVKYKKLAGGGYLKIVNTNIPLALKTLGYNPEEIKQIINYALGTYSFKNSPFINTKSLKEKGFTSELIEKLESCLEGCFDLDLLFNKEILGESFCLNQLNIKAENLKDPFFSILKHLDFTEEEINAASLYLTGTQTLEKCPILKDEHIAVFDCAQACGKIGERFILPLAHVKMVGAVQGFISGGISKTVNLPNSATIEDCSNIYLESWKLGVKSNALYRDGSKLSQALNTTFVKEENSPTAFIEGLIKNPLSQASKVVNLAQFASKQVGQQVTKRRQPPSKRKGYIQKAKIANHTIYFHTGEYLDGTLAEVFIDIHKEGASFKAIMNCFAIAISIGLQYGVPLEEFVDAFTFMKFEPAGIVVGHDNIKFATSIVDYIFRDLAINYLGRYEFAQVHNFDNVENKQPNTTKKISTKQEKITLDTSKTINNHDTNKNVKYEGEMCTECHSMSMVRNGACLVCLTCGTTTGCS